MKITIVGIGYVGISNAFLFNHEHDVLCYDIDEEKINKLNDSRLFNATTKKSEAYNKPDFIFICGPTNTSKNGNLDTTIIEDIIFDIAKFSPDSIIVIKSTIPIGFTDKMIGLLKMKIMFSPEFLKEGTHIEDNLYPERIIIGRDENDSAAASLLLHLITSCIMVENVPVFFCSNREAESSKLLVNIMLASRVAMFNEIDSFCRMMKINSESVINNICSDSRIGNHYNNPSFGFGGYCLPKDTKEIEKYIFNSEGCEIKTFPLLTSITKSNDSRKNFLKSSIVDIMGSKKIGVYKLAMKSGSNNHRESAIIDIIKYLKIYKKIDLIIYDEDEKEKFMGYETTDDINYFFESINLLITNRIDEKLKDFTGAIFTPDIFHRN